MRLCLTVWKIKRSMRMRRRVRSEESEECIGVGCFHFSGRRCRRHSAVRLGKLSLGKAWQQSPGQLRGVYPLPQRHERHRRVRVQIEEREERKKSNEEVLVGGLKKKGGASSRGKEGGMKGERGDCVLQPSGPFTDPERWHWQLKKRKGRGVGEKRSPQFCVWREKSVCITLILFTVIHAHTLKHTRHVQHAVITLGVFFLILS